MKKTAKQFERKNYPINKFATSNTNRIDQGVVYKY